METVIIVFNTQDSLIYNQIHPSQFPTRTEYRQALIDWKKSQHQQSTLRTETIAAIRSLSIEIIEQDTLNTCIATGTPEALAQARKLPGVNFILPNLDVTII